MRRPETLLARLARLPLPLQLAAVTVVAGAALWWQRGTDGRLVDLLLTADQQGRLLFEDKRFDEAASRFADARWSGLASYRAGDYLAAADSFARVASAEGFYNRGNAYMRAFEYARAIASYEQAVAEAPHWAEARENLELARYTLAYVERSREQGDTGEVGGIGADELVYDNTSGRGAETEVTRESAVEAQSAEKWMRSVDTDTAEFLRRRFLLEASRSASP